MVGGRRLKEQARDSYGLQWNSFALGFVIWFLLTKIIYSPLGISLIPEFTMNILRLIPGFASTSFAGWNGMIMSGVDLQSPWLSMPLLLVLIAAIYPATLGYDSMALEAIRDETVSPSEVLLRYKEFGRWFAFELLWVIQIYLLSMLFFVPGVIAAYNYRQASFLMLDDPKLKIIDAFKKSTKIMKGHRLELFFIDLSFTGHVVLQVLSGGLLGFYIMPYMRLTYAGYYQALIDDAKKLEQEQGQEPPQYYQEEYLELRRASSGEAGSDVLLRNGEPVC